MPSWRTLERKEESFQTREAELETAINEVEPGNAQQEAAVNAEIEAFEADKSAHDTAKESLRGDIASLEAELEELERNAPKPPAAEETKSKTIEKRGVATMPTINIRSLPMSQRAFDALPMERRDAMLSSSEVTDFLGQLRAMKGQSRSITGAELTIPLVFLELIAENMYRYSKLLNRVRVRNVTGEARQTIAGTVPEAVWTEMCGAINELSFSFNQITVDGYKVAGFVPVCNSLLEDNDINLASWIVEMLSEAIGLAMDKAILYGQGQRVQDAPGHCHPTGAAEQARGLPRKRSRLGGPAHLQRDQDHRCRRDRGRVLGCADGGHGCHLHPLQSRQSVLGHEQQDLFQAQVQAHHLYGHR